MRHLSKYETALKADEHYSKTIETQFPGKDRWTLTAEEKKHIPTSPKNVETTPPQGVVCPLRESEH